jgi:hypothetical protein
MFPLDSDGSSVVVQQFALSPLLASLAFGQRVACHRPLCERSLFIYLPFLRVILGGLLGEIKSERRALDRLASQS